MTDRFAPLSIEEKDSTCSVGVADNLSESERCAQAAALVKGCEPIQSTLVEGYLEARGINADAIPRGHIGFHKPSNAMLAVGRNANGEVTCVQRLFFGRDGAPIVDDNGKKKRRTKGILKGSALMIPGDGDPLICEGIEDALSLHQATGRPSIASFGLSNLGGVPVADGAHVIIVADNDERGRNGAREAAVRLIERGCAVSIALPDRDAKDANELLTTRGADALRALIEAAEPFARGPQFVSWGDFTMDETGLWVTVTKGRGNNATISTERISSPFEVLGATRDPQGCGWGKCLRWSDGDGRVHERHITDSALHGDPAALAASLANEGLCIDRAHQRALASYLCQVRPAGRVTMVARPGWHCIGGHDVFVLPRETLGPHASETVILDAGAHGPYEARGTLADWQKGVGALVAEHALGVLAVSAALAGPLLALAGIDGGGLNLFGPSSKGKTTILLAGASVWGRGGIPGFMRAWRATANGAAASATDTCIILDELGVVDAREAAAAIYALSNGSGKTRAARDGSAREAKSWRVVVLSSGELPIERKLAEDRGRRAMAGQTVRILDIPADRGAGFGAFDNAGPDGDAAKLSGAIKKAAATAYGTAGPEFVRRLISENVTADEIRAFVDEFITDEVPQSADGQVVRAAERLALIAVAGELATALGVVPWPAKSAVEAVKWAFQQWVAGRGGTDPHEARQAIEQVRLLIQQHGDSRFEVVGGDPDAKPVLNRLGWRKGDGDQREWWVPSEVWRADICSGLDPAVVAKALADRGMLRMPGGRGFQCKVYIGRDRRVNCYVLTASILDGGDDAS